MKKMKDIRGSSVSAIRSAISRKFGLQTTSKGRKTSLEVMEWKGSDEVGNSHKKLFTDKEMLDDLTKLAFPAMNDEKSDITYTDYYLYTAAVSDIILNPKYPTLEVNKKPLELRLRKFTVYIDFVLLLLKN